MKSMGVWGVGSMTESYLCIDGRMNPHFLVGSRTPKKDFMETEWVELHGLHGIHTLS